MKVTREWIPSDDEWDQLWRICPYSTYFQNREWAEIWSEYLEGKLSPSPIGLDISDGTKVIFPYSRLNLYKNTVNMKISSPGYTYGGWLSRISLTKDHQALLYKYLIQKTKDIYIRENPYEPMQSVWKGKYIKPGHTQVIDLSIGYREILTKMSKGHRSAIAQSRRENVYIELASSQVEWEEYFQIYLDSIKRWGQKASVVYSWKLFDILQKKKSPNIKLWLAKNNSKTIAGAICLYSTNQIVYWHGSASSDYFKLRPVNLLLNEVIKDSINQSVRWFDFNPSGGIEGVEQFKKNFGSITKTSDVFQKQSLIVKNLYLLSRMIKLVKII